MDQPHCPAGQARSLGCLRYSVAPEGRRPSQRSCHNGWLRLARDGQVGANRCGRPRDFAHRPRSEHRTASDVPHIHLYHRSPSLGDCSADVIGWRDNPPPFPGRPPRSSSAIPSTLLYCILRTSAISGRTVIHCGCRIAAHRVRFKPRRGRDPRRPSTHRHV
ncbi:hypothetical protein BD413DRAFT_232043 [Trametes elegans]|nr:hypothetical protein BD413DRAFT_232043 [Trametes elegans]